jgi:SNF2 family DNA or RNA helicase
MNNAGYKSFLQWQNSRSGAAYIQYNDSKQILKAAEAVKAKTKSGRQSVSANMKASKTKSKNSNYFRKKFSKMINKPLEKSITFQLIDEKTVTAKLNFFPEPNIICIFREHQMIYDSELKEWVIPFPNYTNLYKTLMNLAQFNLNPIPINTIDIIFEKDKMEQIKFLNQPGKDSTSKKVVYTIDYKEDCQNSPKLSDLPKSLYKSLYRFQKQGIIFGIKKFSRLLIADEMGVGKTVQAISLSSLYQKEIIQFLFNSSLKSISFSKYTISLCNL